MTPPWASPDWVHALHRLLREGPVPGPASLGWDLYFALVRFELFRGVVTEQAFAEPESMRDVAEAIEAWAAAEEAGQRFKARAEEALLYPSARWPSAPRLAFLLFDADA